MFATLTAYCKECIASECIAKSGTRNEIALKHSGIYSNLLKLQFEEVDRMRIQRNILHGSSLRLTSSRSAILGLFLNSPYTLSYSDIEKELGSSLDRVTVYRTLKSFLDKGIVHKVLDMGGVKYGLCSDLCTNAIHQHEHVHFKCTQCGQTNCLDEVDIPDVKLPNGYKPIELNLLIQGICSDCR